MKSATTKTLVSVKAIIMFCLVIAGLLMRACNWLVSFNLDESLLPHLMSFSKLLLSKRNQELRVFVWVKEKRLLCREI